MDYEYLLLNRAELEVLLTGLGAEGIFGIWDEERTIIGDSDVLNALHSLAKKSMITAELNSSAFQIDEKVRQCLDVCMKAKLIFLAVSRENRICCYSCGGYVMTTPANILREGIKITAIKSDEIKDYLQQENILPYMYDEESLIHVDTSKSLADSGEVHAEIQCYDNNGVVMKNRLTIIRTIVGYCIAAHDDAGIKHIKPYAADAVIDWIREVTEKYEI